MPTQESYSNKILGQQNHNIELKQLPTARTGKGSYLELICQVQSIDELDARIRINLQQALIQFVKNERKWASLPVGEQNKLLQKLGTRSQQNNPFAEMITIKGQDEHGHLITRQVKLLLDATRNKNLSLIFDQIINQQIAMTFFEEFAFGLIEHIDRMIALEMKMISVDENYPESYTLPLTYVDVQNDFLPLSPKDLDLIKDNGLGIMVQLIPKFLRLPLNKLYYAISKKAADFPSLALQFYLDSYYFNRQKQDESAQYREEVIRTLFTKCFYAIVRLKGLQMEHLREPEAKREQRFQFFTNSDEDSTQLSESNEKGIEIPNLDAIMEELARLREQEQMLKQRREVHGPAVKVELTFDKMIEDIVQIYRERLGAEAEDEVTYLSRTVWLPQKISPLSEWDKEVIIHHLTDITSEEYLNFLADHERDLIYHWFDIVDQEYHNDKTFAQLEALGETDEDLFKREVLIRFAERHKQIVEQNKETVIKQVIGQITRMLRVGSLTAEMVIRERYESFRKDVLPYILYFSVVNAQGEEAWIESPYPFGKMQYLIQKAATMTDSEGKPLSDSVSLALAQSLLQELVRFEIEQTRGSSVEAEAVAAS